MKILRLFLILLAVVAAVAALVLAAVFNPSVQTWYAQSRLADHPAWHASVGSVSAGLDHVELENLKFEVGGAVVTVPSARAKLPVRTALLESKLKFQGLVAKGWTIELGASLDAPDGAAVPAKEGETSAAVAAQQAAVVWQGLLGGWKLPCDVSLDGAELEGDVYVPRPGGLPQRVHVAIKGGGVRSGCQANLALDVSTIDPWKGVRVAAAHGKLRVVMDSPRTFESLGIEADLVGQGAAVPDHFLVGCALTVRRNLQEETHQATFTRDGRKLAGILAHHARDTGAWAGNWELDLRDSDGAPLLPGNAWNGARVSGVGAFSADAGWSRIELVGQARAQLAHLGEISPGLEPAGPATVAVTFRTEATGAVLHFKELTLKLAGRELDGSLRTLQPFDLDTEAGAIKAARAQEDLLVCNLGGNPWRWLPLGDSKFSCTGGEMRGEFLGRLRDGTWILTPRSPPAASGVTLVWGGRTLAKGLTLVAAPRVTIDTQGWRANFAPLTISTADKRVLEVTGQVSRRAGAEQAIVLAGKWTADLDAVGNSPAQFPGLAGLNARAANGEFSASLGAVSQVVGKFAVTGQDAAHAFTAEVHADIDDYGRIDYTVPLKLTTGADVTDLKAEGSWATAGREGRMNVRLSGDTLVMEHVRRLAPVLASWTGFSLAAVSDARDAAPFWRPWDGTITLQVNQLKDGRRTLADVGGSVEFTADSIQLEHGHYALTPLNPVEFEGTVSYDAAAAEPYALTGKGGLTEFDLPLLLGPAPKDQDPAVEGRFTLEGKFTGRGSNLADLLEHRHEEYRLASKAGMVRILAAHVSEALPDEMQGKVSETLDSTGYMLGKLFKVDSNKVGSGQRKLSKPMEAVLNFSYAITEVGYDEFAVTAVRNPDGTYVLTSVSLTAPEVRVTGTGRVGGTMEQPMRTRPLELELRVGARGKLAELMAKTEMPAEPKDAAGYVMLVKPARFGGSLDRLDFSDWQHTLAKAAVQKPVAGKKSE